MTTITLKQIRVWKVLALGIITFGVYTIVWLVKRNQELSTAKPKMFHWGWLAGALGILFVLAMVLYLVSLSLIADVEQATKVYMVGTYAIFIIMDLAIILWVLRAVSRLKSAVKVPLTTPIIVLLTIFFPPVLAAIIQASINHSANGKKQTSDFRSKYKSIAYVSIVLGIALSVATFSANPPSTEVQNFKRQHQEIRRIILEVKELSEKYAACTTQLNIDYPDGENTTEDKDKYQAAYDECDKIYQKIQNVAERY